MQEKLVSIAMTTYNGEKYLREQLESIFNQTYKNIEVVVTDDCSKDETAQILKEYKQKYGLKYYINETNLGYVKNFEKALSLCKGEYIAFADQDDVWMPEKIEVLMNEIEGVSLVYADAELIDQNDESYGETKKERNIREDKNFPASNLKEVIEIGLQGCASMFERDVLLKAMPFPNELLKRNKIYHDRWIGIVAGKMKGIKFVDKPLIKYRLHMNNNCGINGSGYYGNAKKYLRIFFPPVYYSLRYVRREIRMHLILKELKSRGL